MRDDDQFFLEEPGHWAGSMRVDKLDGQIRYALVYAIRGHTDEATYYLCHLLTLDNFLV